MRIAILSDVHANLTALDAVIADIDAMSPDVVFHGGDLADGGSSPVEVIDRIRDLGWDGVAGNTDEMPFRPEAFHSFASARPAFGNLFAIVEEMAAVTREWLGPERLACLSTLPLVRQNERLILMHGTPATACGASALRIATASAQRPATCDQRPYDSATC